ncbi:MAG TPA: hypothetical protein VK445_09300 [Dissulfurispiraceae bacterium]|nr:hypothetical protein [Dissulfurispiraceae bacterium]
MGLFAFVGHFIVAILMVLIFRKAGYSGLQLLLCFIPVFNIVVYVWFALAEWPIQRELRELKVRDIGQG